MLSKKKNLTDKLEFRNLINILCGNNVEVFLSFVFARSLFCVWTYEKKLNNAIKKWSGVGWTGLGMEQKNAKH